jgi:iron complex outermembrane receptor protein
MKVVNRFTLFSRVFAVLLAMGMALVCGTAMGQEQGDEEEFILEDIVVSAQFTETNLQETPIAITAVTGDVLEERNIQGVEDLGLIIPNAAIRPQLNMWGPNAYIGIRGVDQMDFIPSFEPGVVVYVDDVVNTTVIGSTLELIDLERVEVLRGPQGTLFGKNSIGGAIRLISKTPNGDNTGRLQVTYGDYHRLDFSGSYDFSLIEDRLFARISATSKRIDGYVDRLDFRCQMEANGTPELAGDFPLYMIGYDITHGNCKVGEKGGSQTDAAKLMLRFVPTERLEFNVGIDYTEMLMDTQAETLIRGINPNTTSGATLFVDSLYQDRFNMSILGNATVTDSPFTTFETFQDPLYGTRYPDQITQDFTNVFARVDYDITDNIHLKGILGYREYQQVFATINSNPFSFNTYFVDMTHDQTSYELRLNGSAFDERLDWTLGGYYLEENTLYLGFVTLGTAGIFFKEMDMEFIIPYLFDDNDRFNNDNTSFFVHGIYEVTDKLSLTAGARMTDENKSYGFDHGQLFVIEEPLIYGGKHYDWKLALDYQFTDDVMAYVSLSTGYRSEGTNSKPYTVGQLLATPDEEVLSYEIGARTDWFDNRLRINPTVFYLDYDPRVYGTLGYQCTDQTGTDAGEPVYSPDDCPADSWAVTSGVGAQYWFVYLNAPGTAKGVELDITARPIKNLDINASVGYYDYETDVAPGDPGYIHPDYDLQADWTYNMGVQYRINFDNGAMLIPRIDMYYQGERSSGALDRVPIPGNSTPDYTIFNGRLTLVSPDSHWSISLEAQNLFNKFYWVNYGALYRYDGDTDNVIDSWSDMYGTQAIPGWPRQIGISLRYDFF